VLAVRTFSLAVAFLSGIAVAQPAERYLGRKLTAGDHLPSRTAAQVEIAGQDAGIAHVITGEPGSMVNEAFSMHAGFDSSGTFRKMHSLSTRWVDPMRRIAVTRYNTTYAGPDGRQTDDLAIQHYGGNGIALFAPDSHPRLIPGKGVLWINGRVTIGPEGQATDVLEYIKRLESRIHALEQVRAR
jgi:hypothetical protein